MAAIIAGGGWGIGYAVRAVSSEGWGKLIAALIAAVVGVAVGALIGYAGDGSLAGLLIRSALTGLSMLAAAVVHFVYTEAKEAWGLVAVARKAERELIRERDACVQEVTLYQEGAIRELEAFRRGEAERREGNEAGKDGRRRFVRPDIKTMLVALLMLALLACTDSTEIEAKHTALLVVDITDKDNRETLVERTLARTSLDYGQAVEAYLLGCQGLTLVYRGQVKDIDQPQHKQHLQTVKAELAKVLKEKVATATDTSCSPLASSLIMLAAELTLRRKSGERLALSVASDFEINKDKTIVDGQPFGGLEVVAVLSSPSGRDLARRKQALQFVEKLFAGSRLTITN